VKTSAEVIAIEADKAIREFGVLWRENQGREAERRAKLPQQLGREQGKAPGASQRS